MRCRHEKRDESEGNMIWRGHPTEDSTERLVRPWYWRLVVVLWGVTDLVDNRLSGNVSVAHQETRSSPGKCTGYACNHGRAARNDL